MKQLLFILFFAAIGLTAKSQTGTFTFNATGLATVTGGDSATAIVSYQWATQGAQPGAVVFTNPTSQILTATVSVAGNYLFVYSVKTNTGKTASTTIAGIAYGPQVIHLDFSGSGILKTTLQ